MAVDVETVRRIRAVFVCGISATLSVAAHAVAGGAVPHQDVLVFLAGLAVASGMLAAETRLPVPLLLVIGQVAGHLVLGLHDGHLHTPTPGMLVAHATAVAVAVLLLRGAEKGCEVALAALCRMLPELFRALPVAVAESARVIHRPRVGPGVRLVGGMGSRGPPVVLR
ncbi:MULTISPECIES: hypothetical protein [Rhodococcus]|uniref:Uncharacterized protein n=1 Tax=Rhodococcus pyridinivorans KG-16 TaxID=1441730 RepID=A0A0V9UJW6_9NOCA|nr:MULTISPECIES: hypothetical protein [Rhodococcus]KSZ58293.1 hypothetical protein Z045_14055 [Rhodococcus pyridinivorans KG-16]BDB58232.1 hypothetical protein RDE2_00260 [Rhodococcus sp. RDE2]